MFVAVRSLTHVRHPRAPVRTPANVPFDDVKRLYVKRNRSGSRKKRVRRALGAFALLKADPPANPVARAECAHTRRMREIATHIDIDAGASLVWSVLIRFAEYRRWNPLIGSVLGFARRGHTIMLVQRRGAVRTGRETTVIRAIEHVREPYELHWRGGRVHESWFASERRFRIESLSPGRVRFHQSERFDGIALPLLWRGLQRTLASDFAAMNSALKAHAEQTEAHFTSIRAERYALPLAPEFVALTAAV
jgi:hypothetical protein